MLILAELYQIETIKSLFEISITTSQNNVNDEYVFFWILIVDSVSIIVPTN